MSATSEVERLTDSCLAPTNFPLSHSSENNHFMTSVAVERCQLCTSSKYPFYCKECVQKGNFTFSTKPDRPPFGLKLENFDNENESYAQKLERLREVKDERNRTLDRINDLLGKLNPRRTKACNIHSTKERISELQKAITAAKQISNRDKENLTKQKRINERLHEKRRHHALKKQNLGRHIVKLKNHIEGQNEDCCKLEDQLVSSRQEQIAKLQEFIFPIKDITQTIAAEQQDSLTQSRVSMLAEACHTTYIRGRWVYADSGWEQQYCIVEASLPGNGDYSPFHIWAKDRGTGTLTTPSNDPGEPNPAHTIGAGLTFTAQLVSILSHFLDIRLPRRLCFSIFGTELSEPEFNYQVAKLNHNILHLCLAQGVALEGLHAQQTIRNLLMLFQCPHLGRALSFDQSNELISSLIENIQNDEEKLESHDEELDLIAEASGASVAGERDWDFVQSTTLPDSAETEGTMEAYMSTTQSRHLLDNTSGGLMASVASFWKGMSRNTSEDT